jgi:hypothetical protein
MPYPTSHWTASEAPRVSRRPAGLSQATIYPVCDVFAMTFGISFDQFSVRINEPQSA